MIALFLQSNDMISQAVGNGASIEPDLGAYGGITGIFGQFFLISITAITSVVHNQGIAIILTAILVRVLLLPLTRTQIRGMRIMQLLQPVQKEIQRFYPNKQDQNAKTMELYSKYKINPLAGCLPMLVQLPILFGVYRALYDPSFAGHNFLGIQLLFPVSLSSARSFGLGPELQDLIDVTVFKLGLQSQIIELPASLPLIGGSFWYLPALVLVALYAASSFAMQRVMRKVNAPDPAFAEEFKAPPKQPGAPEQMDFGQQMQKQMGIMNIFILVIAFIFSAGALLYFVVQNVMMTLEYQFLPNWPKGKGGKQVDLDPKELKKFIRKPPPPAGAARQAQAKKREDKGKAAETDGKAQRKGGRSEAGRITKEDGVSGADEGANVPTTFKRPRKKRRKR
ncbi:membrane protein insertase YidC [bacterium]|nr:membrane protein insertase YidC [bacterium]